MQPLSNFQTVVVDQKPGYSSVEIEPLEAGYGHTLGNSLRRVLLTSISGYALTEAKIKGVSHQFTTIKGVKEDIVDVVLNLKQVRITSQIENTGSCRLQVKAAKAGTKVVAGDIQCDAGFEIANPDFEIATLEAGATLDIQMKIGYGRGYVLSSDIEVQDSGAIAIDALFSPVVKVAYKVEATRVGRRTDFDKLILEIWTNGTIEAKDALKNAAEIMVDQFQQIVSPVKQKDEKSVTEVTPEEAEVLKLTVEELDLPTRIANALRKGGYATVSDLVVVEMGVVAKVKNLGDKSVGIVQKALLDKGVDFKG